MFIVSNLLTAVAEILSIIFTVFYWFILIRAIISWVNPDPHNPVVQFLYRVTDPVLDPIRRFLPAMPIDISPIIAFLAILFVQSFLVRTLFDLAYRLR